MSEKRITRYSRGEVPEGKTDWARLRAMTEEEIQVGAESDPDNLPATPAELRMAEAVFPSERGKVPVYIRLDAEVVEHYKAGGPGYQTRINADLLAIVRRRQRAARRGYETGIQRARKRS